MYKNLGLILDAMKILKERGVDFKMIIVGNGPDFDKYKKMVEDAGLSEDYVFTGAIKDRSLLQGYYLRSDMFIFPSTFDTSSLVPIEAAAHKLPTILVKGSCTAESIEDGVNGFLAEESGEAFANRLQEIISEKGLIKKVGEEANRSVYRSWEMVAEEVYEKYQKLIEEHAKKDKK